MDRKEVIDDRKEDPLFVKLFKIAVFCLAILALCFIVAIAMTVVSATLRFLSI